jgi:hypothetical protein
VEGRYKEDETMIADGNETAEERFRRLATKRTNVVLDGLRRLGNLSSRTNYSYSEEDVEKILTKKKRTKKYS